MNDQIIIQAAAYKLGYKSPVHQQYREIVVEVKIFELLICYATYYFLPTYGTLCTITTSPGILAIGTVFFVIFCFNTYLRYIMFSF